MIKHLQLPLLLLFLIFLFPQLSYANTSPIDIDYQLNTENLLACDSCSEYCFNIPFNDLDEYHFQVNGVTVPISNFSSCDIDTVFAYTYFSLLGMGNLGPYRLDSWMINNAETANGQTFNNPQGMANLMNQIDPGGNWTLNSLNFLISGGIPSSSYSTIDITNLAGTSSTSSLNVNSFITANGSMLCIPIGNNNIVITEIATGNVIETLDINVSPEVGISYVSTPETCDPNGDVLPGSINITTSNGKKPITYQWQGSNGFSATTEDIDNLPDGLYSVTATDNNGCVAYATNIPVGDVICTTDIYVDHLASGNNDGSSWVDAFTNLQDALALGSGTTIHIAKGTYLPTDSGLRGKSFEISSETNILGGYPNGGGNRSPETHTTILSGEIDNVAGYDGNSYHVIKIINAVDVVLDGIHVKDGNANNTDTFGRARGGGIYCNASNVQIINSTIRRNRAIFGGGIFSTLSPSLVIEDSEIKLNQAENGSALYLSNSSNTYIKRTKIIDNNSLVRCAIEINNASYSNIENSLIANNTSTKANAIAFIATNRNQACDINNSTIIGGDQEKFLLVFQIGFGDQLDVNIFNSIVAQQDLSFVKSVNASNNNIFNFTHSHSYFQGSSVIGNGTNNLFSAIDGDLLLNPDYSLNECSPAANSGANSYTSTNMDILGNSRIHGGTVDIGAYETQSSCFSIPRKGEVFAKALNIYPNPTSDYIQISTQTENIHCSVLDMAGREVFSSFDLTTIDISHLPKGMYLLHVSSKDGLLWTEKVMKY